MCSSESVTWQSTERQLFTNKNNYYFRSSLTQKTRLKLLDRALISWIPAVLPSKWLHPESIKNLRAIGPSDDRSLPPFSAQLFSRQLLVQKLLLQQLLVHKQLLGQPFQAWIRETLLLSIKRGIRAMLQFYLSQAFQCQISLNLKLKRSNVIREAKHQPLTDDFLCTRRFKN